jgi:isopenicillin-N epimerase
LISVPFSHSVDYRSLWVLDPKTTFLNHGSFGACPIAILEQQRSLRTQLEQNPVRFFAVGFEEKLDEARSQLAQFIGADPDRLVFVPNATTGVNTVLRSLATARKWRSGDELLTTNHEYNASRNALDVVAEQTGATVVVADIPFPIQSSQQIIDAVLAKVSSRTRLVLLDHVSSQTALIFPIQAIAKELTTRGIELLVDGAHAPGMVPLNLRELGATYYTGNCHKWICSPKGAAFLYIAGNLSEIRPLVISHGANSPRRDRTRFHLEFDWVGTGDPTPYLCLPATLQFMSSLLPGGWTELMQQNHAKALQARTLLCQTLDSRVLCPEDMMGSMAVIALPKELAPGLSAEAVQGELGDRFHIEVPVIPWGDRRLLRISAQLYNSPQEYDFLAQSLLSLKQSDQQSDV